MSKTYKKRKQAAHTKKKSPRNVPQETSKFAEFVNEWLWLFTFIIIVAVAACLIIFIPRCDDSCTACADTCSAKWSEMTSCSSKEDETEDRNDVASDEIEQLQMPEEGETVAVLETSKGIIKLRVFPENAPLAVESFMTHVRDGYYDNVLFHRVIDDMMIQTGDPTGIGNGGESIWGGYMDDELDNGLYHFYGAVSMANTGAPNTSGSQFFIVESSECQYDYATLVGAGMPNWAAELYQEVGGVPLWDHCLSNATNYLGHTVFGQVFEGMDVVGAIAAVETDENDGPVEEVYIIKAYLESYSASGSTVVSPGEAKAAY